MMILNHSTALKSQILSTAGTGLISALKYKILMQAEFNFASADMQYTNTPTN